MRGKILQYNGSDGRGIIVVDGQQHPFGIGAWKGDVAPVVGKTVEVGLVNGQIDTVSLVGDDVLLKEKTAELTGKLGSFVGDLSKGSAGGAGGTIVQFYGRNLLIAFGVFLIGTVFLNAISMNFLGVSQGQTMWNIAKMMEAFGGGSIKTLLLLSYLGFAVPFFWKDKRSWLVLLLPLITILYAFWQGRKMMGGGGGMGGGSIFDVLGLGFYVSAAAAIFIGLTGFKRFKTQ
jgi:hypothetical protein